jgi:hypothetical protein
VTNNRPRENKRTFVPSNLCNSNFQQLIAQSILNSALSEDEGEARNDSAGENFEKCFRFLWALIHSGVITMVDEDRRLLRQIADQIPIDVIPIRPTAAGVQFRAETQKGEVVYER